MASKAVTAIDKLNVILKQHKATLATTLGDDGIDSRVKTFLPTGLLTLDVILGGGWPMGRVVEIFGHEASGKSMLAAQACASAQALGYLTVYLDNEFAVDQDFFKSLGVDLDKLFYITPETLEDVFNILLGFIEFKTQHYDRDYPMIVVWDSIASTTLVEERSKAWEQKGYSTFAIYMSSAFRKVRHLFGAHNILFFLVNQIRSNVGVMFGEQYTTYGGKAPKFYSSIRLNLDVESKVKLGEKGERKRIVGHNIRAQCVKNKIVTPYRECVLPLSTITSKIDEPASVMIMLKELGLVTGGAGGNYKIPDFVGMGEVTFKTSDLPEFIAEYHHELTDYLTSGWLKVPGKRLDLEDEEDASD